MGLEHSKDKATEGEKSHSSAADLSAEQWHSNSKVEMPRNSDLNGTQLTNLTIDGLDKKASTTAAPSGDEQPTKTMPNEGKSTQSGTQETTEAKAAKDAPKADTTEPKAADAKPGDKPADSKNAAEQGKDKPAELQEANSYLFKAADSVVNQSIYKLPKWATLKLPAPTPDLGCVSSFSNRYRESLKMAGVIASLDENAFKDLYQVNMTEMNKVMGLNSADPTKRLLKEISASEIKEGDIIEGQNPGTTTRHVGIVGGIENGKRMVYDNYGGTWRKEGLEDRFSRYKEEKFFRAYLPPKK